MPLEIIDIMENKVLGPLFRSKVEEAERKGMRKGEAAVIRVLLEDRFGQVPESLNQRLEAASDDELKQWAKRILAARSIEEVFA